MNPPATPPSDRAPTGGLVAGQTVGGRYVLKRPLGQGGMGVVWLALDTRLEVDVALKFLPPHVSTDPAAIVNLRRETIRSRRLSHPNIVRIHDLHEAPDAPRFLSMEYVDGPNLHDLLVQRGHHVLAWEFLAPLVRQLCQALDYAHTEGILHRDLKPANLMLDANGRLKLADFGLGCGLGDAAIRTAGMLGAGTLPYMSPQQAAGEPPQVADDIYSLGATLYELLTSRPPFHAGDIAHQVQHTRPDSIPQRLLDLGISNDMPAEVSALILRCLAKDPSQRPPGAMAILDCLAASEQAAPRVGHGSSAAVAGTGSTPTCAPPLEDTAPDPRSGKPTRSRGAASAWLAGTSALLVILGAGWWWRQQTPAPTPVPASAILSSRPVVAVIQAPAGYEALFNGRDLSGWVGDTNIWMVREGTIVGRAPGRDWGDQDQAFLQWPGTVADFELRLTYRVSRPGNSGVLYRTKSRGDGAMDRYEAEIWSHQAGSLRIEDEFRQLHVAPGQSAVAAYSRGMHVLQSVQKLPGEIDSPSGPKRWNELVLVARGHQFTHDLNGNRVMEAADEVIQARRHAGGLALELRGDTQVEFSNIFLKRLEATPVPPAPPMALAPAADPRASITNTTQHRGEITAIDVSPDGRIAASAAQDGTVRLWARGDFRQRSVLSGHQGRVNAVAFSPVTAGLLASGGEDATVRLWDAAGATHQRLLKGHVGPVNAVAFAHDRETLFSAGDDGTLKQWDLSTGLFIRSIEARSRLLCLALSPDGQLLVGGDDENRIQCWRASDGWLGGHIPGHAWPVRRLAFSPDGLLLASASLEPRILVWDMPARRLRRAYPTGRGSVASLVWGDNKQILFGNSLGEVHELALDTGRITLLQIHNLDARVTGLARTPDGGLAYGHSYGYVAFQAPPGLPASHATGNRPGQPPGGSK